MFVGKRKTAVAVATKTENKEISINDRKLNDYFLSDRFLYNINNIMVQTGYNGGFKVRVAGGGISAQSEAVRHAISKALSSDNEESKNLLKKLGFLTNDPRQVERKKAGKKKARKAFGWAKR